MSGGLGAKLKSEEKEMMTKRRKRMRGGEDRGGTERRGREGGKRRER